MQNKNNWVKIISFDNLYEAQIKKQLLENAGVEAVIVNARDSLFLVGTADLYVKEENEKKALFLIEQFAGLTKINSFILKKPILLFQNYLKDNGIESILKTRESEKYLLDNYELYVKNEDLDKVVPYLTGEAITDWTVIEECESVRQTAYRVEILEQNNIKSFIIKKRDSDYHLEKVKIYVENENIERSKSILEELKGWTQIKEYEKRDIAEIREHQLSQKGIKTIIKFSEDKYSLFVPNKDEGKANDIIKAHTEWIEVTRTDSFVEAEALLNALMDNQIDASILSLRDNVFILGGYALYVPKLQATKALEIINDIKNSKIEE